MAGLPILHGKLISEGAVDAILKQHIPKAHFNIQKFCIRHCDIEKWMPTFSCDCSSCIWEVTAQQCHVPVTHLRSSCPWGKPHPSPVLLQTSHRLLSVKHSWQDFIPFATTHLYDMGQSTAWAAALSSYPGHWESAEDKERICYTAGIVSWLLHCSSLRGFMKQTQINKKKHPKFTTVTISLVFFSFISAFQEPACCLIVSITFKWGCKISALREKASTWVWLGTSGL